MTDQKKVLWFSNIPFSGNAIKSTGTWLSSMGEALHATGSYKIYNISQSAEHAYKEEDIDGINQWSVPYERLDNSGLPSKRTITFIQDIVEKIEPDIIHIWGTENYWGLLTARGYIKGNVLLEIQGLMFTCAKVFYAGLSFYELLKTIGIKEVLKPSKSILIDKIKFKKWGKFEIEILRSHNNISTQSDWIRAHVNAINSKCRIHNTGMILRDDFTKSAQWQNDSNTSPVIFTSCSISIPYKGLHVLFKALSVLKHSYPNIVLRIAGAHVLNGIKTSGYIKFLKQEILRLNLSNSIEWLGSLDSKKIVLQMHASSVVVIPSFVESYSMFLAEAMAVGVPAVVAYSGAMPELAQHNKSALFYTATDEVMCAHNISRIIQSKSLAWQLSNNSRAIGLERNDSVEVIQKQMEIYKMLLASEEK